MAEENGLCNSGTDAASEQRQDVLSVLDAKGGVSREQLFELQQTMLGMPQLECPVKHHFAPGLYAREIFIPAGSCVIGKIHRHSHVNTISQGRCRVVTEFGSESLEAPVSFVSQVGTKRAVYAETDVIWTTYHPTVVCDIETDLEKIEREVIAEDYEALSASSYITMKESIQ